MLQAARPLGKWGFEVVREDGRAEMGLAKEAPREGRVSRVWGHADISMLNQKLVCNPPPAPTTTCLKTSSLISIPTEMTPHYWFSEILQKPQGMVLSNTKKRTVCSITKAPVKWLTDCLTAQKLPVSGELSSNCFVFFSSGICKCWYEANTTLRFHQRSEIEYNCSADKTWWHNYL